MSDTPPLEIRVIGSPALPPHIASGFSIDQESGCWLWQKSKSRDGYGWTSLANKTYQVHRLVYRLLIGEPPAGLVLDHLCRARHCVNPSHMQPVTNRTNLERSPITPAGQVACLRCGSEFNVIGRTTRQRRCPKCVRIYHRDAERRRRARVRAERRNADA